MKGYGLPRWIWLDCVDKNDITWYGLKTGFYGEKRRASSKKRYRRTWKKIYRSQMKMAMNKEVKDS